MSLSNSQRNFVIAAVVIGAGFFLMKKKDKVMERVAPRSKSDVSAPVEAPRTEVISSNEAQAPAAKTSILRKSRNAMIHAGLQMIPSKESQGKLKFNFRGVAEAVWCKVGDFDFIRGFVSNLNDPVILATIEPLHGSRDKIFRAHLSAFDLLKGRTLEAQLPAETKARDYGFYMCFDFKKTGECVSKKPLNPLEWNYLLTKAENRDRLLYFQMLTVRETEVYLIPSQRWSEGSMDKMKKILEPVIETVESLEILQKMMRKVESAPGRVGKGALELPIPYKNSRSQKC